MTETHPPTWDEQLEAARRTCARRALAAGDADPKAYLAELLEQLGLNRDVDPSTAPERPGVTQPRLP